jgi:dihydrodipicolinate synthase/N-acetylneuraminate lyase
LLTAQNLKGNWGTLLLPVNSDESVDFRKLANEIDYLVAAGLDGIYSNGTAGEMHNQSEEEFDEIQLLLAEKCHKEQVPFQIGASHPVPIITLERIQRFKRLNPDAFQVILPEWIPLQPEEQVLFLKKIASAAGNIPLVLYNPPQAKNVLTPKGFEFLMDRVPELIGIKVGGGDSVWYEQMRACSKRISIFIPGHFLATGVKQEVAAGAYSNIACLSPQGAQQWWSLMHTDLEEALSVQALILRFFQKCIVPYQKLAYSNPALDKFLASIGGWGDIGTRLRWPYRWIPEEHVPHARKIAKRLLPAFLLKK